MGFETQLGNLITAVWNKEQSCRRAAPATKRGGPRRHYLSEGEIYEVYARVGAIDPVDLHTVKGFLLDLRGIQREYRPRIVVQVTNTDWRPFSSVWKDTHSSSAARAQDAALDAWEAFYHLVSPHDVTPRRRIYVNTRGWWASLRVVDAIVKSFPSQASGGVYSVKVAGPGAVRKDSVVVYCADDIAVDFVRGLLRGVPQQHLRRGVPGGTAEVRPGIAVADEPSRLRVWEDRHGRPCAATSFGDFYSKLLHMALNYPDPRLGQQQPRPPASRDEYRQNVVTALRAAGVDPGRPHRIARSEVQLRRLMDAAEAARNRRRA